MKMMKKNLKFFVLVFFSLGFVHAAEKQNFQSSSLIKDSSVKKDLKQKKNVKKADCKLIMDINQLCLKKEEEKKELNLTIADAIEMALEHRPSLKAFNFEVKSQEALAKKALGGYFPQMALSGSGAAVEHAEGIRPQLDFTISQLLYSFAGPLQQHRIAKKDVAIAEYSRQLHEDLIRNQVEVGFLRCWILDEKIKFIRELDIASKERYDLAKSAFNQGLIDKNSWMKAQASYSQDFADVDSYKHQLDAVRNSLEYFLGKNVFSDTKILATNLIWDSSGEVVFKLSLEDYYSLALENRKEIKSKIEEIKRCSLQSDFYIKSYMPSLNLNGSQSYTKQVVGIPWDTYGQVGMSLDWNLFDGLTNKHLQESAKAQKLKAIMEKDDLVQQIKTEVQQNYHDLRELMNNIGARNVVLDQAKNQFILSEKQFEVGLISKVDFETAKQALEQAKFSWLELRVAVEIKRSDLDFACGYPKKEKI